MLNNDRKDLKLNNAKTENVKLLDKHCTISNMMALKSHVIEKFPEFLCGNMQESFLGFHIECSFHQRRLTDNMLFQTKTFQRTNIFQ